MSTYTGLWLVLFLIGSSAAVALILSALRLHERKTE